jgi:hypothetical protein
MGWRTGKAASNTTCQCGKLADYKVMVSAYPLRVKPRPTKSGTTFGVCKKCLQLTPSGANPKLRTALSQAYVEIGPKFR